MRSKGLNIRVPRLGANRFGVFYVRSSAEDASGRRKVTQRSLGTKDPLLAKVLALRFCLNLVSKELMADSRKHNQTYEIDLSTGKVKADGPEDHALAMEAVKHLMEGDNLERMFRQHAPMAPQPTGADSLVSAAAQLLGQGMAAMPKPNDVGKKLRVALDRHLDDEKRRLKSQRTVKEKEALFVEFVEAFGKDILLNQITKADISRQWRPLERDRPSQKVSKVKLARLAAEAAVKGSKDAGPPKLSLARLEKRRGFLRGFFEWAIEDGCYLHDNPMGQAVAKKKDIRHERSSYRPFTGTDLIALFGSNYVSEMAKPDWYWVPLISLYSGARLNEIASLTVDVFQEIDGVKTFDITDSKTDGGRRTVPIHSQLLSLRLWEYVEFLRKSGQTRLFWFRPAGTVSKSTGEMWGKWVQRCGIADPAKVFHSFRSTAITNMHNSPAPNPAAIRSAVGHTGGLTGSHGHYVRGSDLLLVQAAIESLEYPSMNGQNLKLADPTFGEFYRTRIEVLASPKHAAQKERRQRRAALQAKRAEQIARAAKKKGQ